MAKYRLTQPAFIEGKYYEADVRNPQVVELGDDVEPPSVAEPVDSAAKSALEKIDKQKHAAALDARNAVLNPQKYVPPEPKLPKRELVKMAHGEDSGATPDTHQRPAPPSVPGTEEQRPQDLGPKEDQSQPTRAQIKRAADKDKDKP